MKRQIKFRGKATANGHWVYGSLIDYGDKTFAIRNRKSQPWVQAETVGQFTGLHDRNGKEIYEGDIVLNGNNTYRVEYNTALACWIAAYDWPDSVGNWQLSKEHCLRNEVVGNIHEPSKS